MTTTTTNSSSSLSSSSSSASASASNSRTHDSGKGELFLKIIIIEHADPNTNSQQPTISLFVCVTLHVLHVHASYLCYCSHLTIIAVAAMVVEVEEEEEEYPYPGTPPSPAPALTRTRTPSPLFSSDSDDDDDVWYDALSDDGSSYSQTQPRNGQKHDVEGEIAAATTTTIIRPNRRVSFDCDNHLSRQARSSEVEVEALRLSSSSSSPLSTSVPPMEDVHFGKQVEHKPEEGVVLSLSPLSTANFSRDENNPTEDKEEEEDVAHEQCIDNEANSEHSLVSVSSLYDSSHSLRCSLSLRSIDEEDDKGDDTDDDVPVAVDMVEEPTNIKPNTSTADSVEHGGDLQVQVQSDIDASTPPLVDQGKYCICILSGPLQSANVK